MGPESMTDVFWELETIRLDVENTLEVTRQSEARSIFIQQIVSGTDRLLSEFSINQGTNYLPITADDRLKYIPAQQGLLNRLPRVDARYNCGFRTLAPSCLPNTRVALLVDIFTWTDDPKAKKIYWLHGLAGTGKSTIAQTVAERLDKAHRLGASFFFSRDAADRRDPLRVLPTIAHQLAEFDPEFKRNLAISLDSYKDAGTASLGIQVEKLLHGPLQATAASSSPASILIVIDALDECEGQDLVTSLLRLMSEFILGLPNIDFKLFITSRPEPHIQAGFTDATRNRILRPFVLHNIEESIVEADIEVFLRHKLAQVAGDHSISPSPDPWPSSDEIMALTKRAGALFIVASTSIMFISDPDIGAPKEQLRALLSNTQETENSPYEELDKLYLHVLDASVGRFKNADHMVCRRFREVVGTIITVLDPLPLVTLQSLLRREMEYIGAVVRRLRSVLILPPEFTSETEPVRVCHHSFPNYLTERCLDPRFAIDPSLHHGRLALACLDILNSFLKRDICQIPNPFAKNSDVPDLGGRLAKAVLPHHKYACRYWAQHLQATLSKSEAKGKPGESNQEANDGFQTNLLEAVDKFAKEKLLQWLEVLSLLGWLDVAIPALKATESWLKVHKASLS
ncbi:hypothetical protein FRC02_010122 [Tulasnella sp. 418]|nr:hypothetical protein FRC02_010122 [Tulasnella sp. 418]